MAPLVYPRLQEKSIGSVQDKEKVLLASYPCLPKTQTGYTQILITLVMHGYTLGVSWLWFSFPELLFSAQELTIKVCQKGMAKNVSTICSLNQFSYIHRNGLPFSRWVSPVSTSSSCAMLTIDGNSKDDIKRSYWLALAGGKTAEFCTTLNVIISLAFQRSLLIWEGNCKSPVLNI